MARRFPELLRLPGGGIEPPTSCFRRRSDPCSPAGIRQRVSKNLWLAATRIGKDVPALPTELRAHNQRSSSEALARKKGGPGGTRTRDQAINSRCSPSGIRRELGKSRGDEDLPRRRPLSYCSKRDLNPISPNRCRNRGALPDGAFFVVDVVPTGIRHGLFLHSGKGVTATNLLKRHSLSGGWRSS